MNKINEMKMKMKSRYRALFIMYRPIFRRPMWPILKAKVFIHQSKVNLDVKILRLNHSFLRLQTAKMSVGGGGRHV